MEFTAIDHYLTALIDIESFIKNIKFIQSKFPQSKIILPVKANAYGHGDIIISKTAEKLNIDYLAIARVSEGIHLRKNKINLPIINLGVELDDNIKIAILNDIELSISSFTVLKQIEFYANQLNKKIPVHLKIDTGMRRLGCSTDECLKIAEYINQSPQLHLKSIYTHYASSESNPELTSQQSETFYLYLNQIKNKQIEFDFYHLYNSGAIINPPLNKIPQAVRPGIMCYGYSPDDNDNDQLFPVMTLKSRVINIKKVPKNSGVSYGYTYLTEKTTYLATIPLGYGDGFPRILSNQLQVSINKKNYYQRGRISMDLTVIEVDENVKIGDDVYIFGPKSKCPQNASDLAKLANTISYEITTSLTQRVERKILNH